MRKNLLTNLRGLRNSGLTKMFTGMALLLFVVTGVQAQTTHVVTQATVNNIFNGAGYTLGNAVAAGDVLDFQGTIDLETAPHLLVINKQVTVLSSTKDAVLKLHTPMGDRSGNNPGNTFVINADGAGTTVQDIRLENTGAWLYHTSNVTFTRVTIHVDSVSLCAGVGHVAIRYSDHITFDSCTVYTKDNGGSGCCVLTASSNCTFQNTRFENVGNVGNPLYIGNPYNTVDKPSTWGNNMVSDSCKVLNCTIIADVTSGLAQFRIMNGLRHRVENCTSNVQPSFSTSATELADGFVIRNNTFTKGLTVPQYSTAENNKVNLPSGNALTVQKGATATGNSVIGNVNLTALDITFTNNKVLGKLTHSQKNATITGNTIISTEEYAVYLSSTANDANNTVTGHILRAAAKGGDEAVSSRSTSNTVNNNQSQSTTGDVTWNFDAATGTLTIGGTGAMADYEPGTAPWAFFSDKITRVVIDEEVTAIGNNTFSGCTAVNDVFVKSDNVPTIGSNAFNASAPIYVPQGMGAAYRQAWTDYANRISEFMSCGAGAMAIYDVTTHTLTICGTGAMADFASASDQPWASLQGQIQQVVVEGPITAIGTNAFASCSALTAATLAGTGTTIADGAFNGNATGRRIFVPAAAIAGYGESTYATDIYATGLCGATGSEESITWELNAATKALVISGTGAMLDFSTNNMPWYPARANITSITIEPGVTTIGNNAFRECGSLTTVSLPAGLTTLGTSAFTSCGSLASIVLPEGLTTIGNSSFYGCSSMASVSIPEGVTTIQTQAFYGCISLDTVVLPSSVTTLGGSAFYGCTGLVSVNIPAGVTEIGGSAFRGCSGLTSIDISAGVTFIGSSAFRNCSGLTSVNIPASVSEIGYYAFQECTGLTSIVIPDGVTFISSSAFYGCTGLTTVSLPSSVTGVGSSAFRDCSNLASVFIFAPSLSTYGSNAFNGNAAGRKIYVPAAAVDTYKSGWSAYQNDILPYSFHSVRLAAGTEDAANWSIASGNASVTGTQVLENVMSGSELTASYSGTRKVKSVKAVKYVPPAATVTTAPTATAATIAANSTAALVNAGAANGGTMMYAVTTTNAQPASTADFSATRPTAEGREAGTYYVWYYAKADADHSDSEIAGPVSVTLPVITTVTWNSTNVFNSDHQHDELDQQSDPLTYEGITISMSGPDDSYFRAYDHVRQTGSLVCYGQYGDSFTFEAPSGKKFCKIEIINDEWSISFDQYGDWTQPEDNKVVWSGTAANAVTLGTVFTSASSLNSIVFKLIDAQ